MVIDFPRDIPHSSVLISIQNNRSQQTFPHCSDTTFFLVPRKKKRKKRANPYYHDVYTDEGEKPKTENLPMIPPVRDPSGGEARNLDH